MLLDDLLEALQDALVDCTDWSVYLSYDPTPFEKRESQFLVLGLDSWETQEPFWTATMQCYAFSAKLYATMLAPPDTNESELNAAFCNNVISGLLSSGYAMRSITCGTPTYARQFQKLQIRADFTIDGIYQMQREEATT